jgi:hypothetical protein
VQEAILAEEQARSLYPPDRWDLLMALEETHVHVDGSTTCTLPRSGDYSSWLWGFLMP